MFWGLEIEPGKKYKQTVEKSFHVSMACLRFDQCPDQGYVSFFLNTNNTDFVLCNLHRDKAVQVQLDLNFSAGDEIVFHTKGGRNKVYLSGYLLDDEDADMLDESGWMDAEESDDESIPQLQLPGGPAKKIDIKRKNPGQAANIAAKVAKVDEDTSSDDEDDDEDDEKLVQANGEEESDDSDDEEDEQSESDDSSDEEVPAAKQSPAKTPQGGKVKPVTPQQKQGGTPTVQMNGKSPANTPKPKSPVTPNLATPKKQTLEGGVVVVDTKVGAGQPAKSGKMVTVYYSGRLKSTNKQFDATQSGAGFKFRLGRGEVIKGWDIGVGGMKVGGKRTVTIPPALAYGNKGAPPTIPPNSALVFDIELKGVS